MAKKNWLKVVSLGTVTLLSAVVLAACGSSKSSDADKKQVLNLPASAQLDTIDISKSTGYGQTGNVFESLFRLGKNGKAEAGLASKTKVSADGKTYTFTIRKNAKWSNGDPITAQDFVYSWQRTVTPKTASPYAYLFEGIKNASDIVNGKKDPSTLGIKATDKHTVVVSLDQPIAYFKVLMAYPLFGPQNQKVVEKYGSKYGTNAKYTVYSGPFKISKWNGTANNWTFVKNNDYWDKKAVKLDKITYNVVSDSTSSLDLYQTGKLDMTQLDATQVANYASESDYKTYAYSYVSYLAYNYQDKNTNLAKLFNNKDFRQGVSAALDRKQLAKKVVGVNTIIPTGFVSTSLASNPTTGKDFSKDQKVAGANTFNKALVTKKWAAAQKATGVKSAKITLLAGSDNNSDPATKEVVQYIKAQLEKLMPGLSITIKTMPTQSAKQLQDSGDFDLTLSGWGADFNDPISFLQVLTNSSSYNKGKYNSAKYNALVQKASTTDANDPAKRWDDMVQASQLLTTDQAVTPLYQSVYSWLQKSDVKGLVHNTAGTQWSYKNAYIK
ncbi:peptide ABC transporter substrate-binding protein [Lacticaseibacillus sharpeae]|uniref:ABC transporter periplasmic subunit n=1 Tax=Lacticaseibacillus sharpeae JCM 1186 = DSM 20505 TaxID=1291052 RepID=A0A0R1ZLK2_9LACO|nr:peptide ABC transporter substrate-binding protein [Lacticaseibacillus sharpeae]KRM55274.1 ABC transporter periplasmic subunit [Lacticaseibacillus sharpeae JCM 1186 = DSM 20505]